MRNRSRIFSILLVCLLLTVPALVLAQTTGTIEGTITDQSGAALPGVTVDLAGASLQGARSAVTSADGRYRFLSVAPGAYTVTATLSGFGRVQKKATVTLDATITANLQMNLSTTAEVTVTGEAPLIDTSSTTGGSTYTAKVIVGPAASAATTPTSSSRTPASTRTAARRRAARNALTIYGATSVENQYIIDGVNTTNVIKGFQGKALNGEFIQEVEVKTGGYQAEYGRALGGVVNVITKSGGNEFHGDAFGYYDSFATAREPGSLPAHGHRAGQHDLQRDGPDTLTGMRIADYEKLDGGFDLGGFAWKDRIWFFMAYDRVIYPTSGRALRGSARPVGNNTAVPARTSGTTCTRAS